MDAITVNSTQQRAGPWVNPRPFHIYRNKRGWPRWYQRYLEAWWIITGRWSLHRAWQAGIDLGVAMEYRRIVVMGGR